MKLFGGGKSRLFPSICCKCKLFSHEFQSGKAFLRCPKLETGFLALPLRPQAIVVFGVHLGAIRKQELCSLHLAAPRRPVERRPTSGAFPGPCAAVASGGRQLKRPRPQRRPMWAAELCTHSNDKRAMNVLDSTSSNMFNAKYTHKQSQTQRKSFAACCLQHCLQ